MAITFICPDRDTTPWIQALKELDPTLEIRVWPQDHPREEIEMALTWAHPAGALQEYPRLGCICSMGAGIDHLLTDPKLPDPDLPGNPTIVRLVDQKLVRDMSEYLLLAVLYHFRQFDFYQAKKQKNEWQPLLPRKKEEMVIGIMGLGQLGKAAAKRLQEAGFSVCGWRNSPKKNDQIPSFHGREQLDSFLSRAQILDNLNRLRTGRPLLNQVNIKKEY